MGPVLLRKVNQFRRSETGAGLVEYAVALVVVAMVGGLVLALGGDIAAIIDGSAGAF